MSDAALFFFCVCGADGVVGIFLDEEARSIIGQGNEIKNSNQKPRKEDIVQEA